jgi:hypothetical protein
MVSGINTYPRVESVLVVELGYVADEACIYQPKAIDRAPCVKHRFNITGIPQPEINNQTWSFVLGAVVGGSSAVNGRWLSHSYVCVIVLIFSDL